MNGSQETADPERHVVRWSVGNSCSGLLVLADPPTASVIDPAVVSYEPEGRTMGLGVRNHIRVKMLGMPVKLTSETIEWEPGSRMGFGRSQLDGP